MPWSAAPFAARKADFASAGALPHGIAVALAQFGKMKLLW